MKKIKFLLDNMQYRECALYCLNKGETPESLLLYKLGGDLNIEDSKLLILFSEMFIEVRTENERLGFLVRLKNRLITTVKNFKNK